MPSKQRAALARTGPAPAAAVAGRGTGRARGERAGDWESIEKVVEDVEVDEDEECECECEWAATDARSCSAIVWSSARV